MSSAETPQEDDRSGRSWTDGELRICLEAYYRLWEADQRGDRVSKAALRREALKKGLIGRSESSYEFRMQNISALLDELGMPFVRGYLPRKHVGEPKMRLISMINDVWRRDGISEVPTADQAALETRVAAALEKSRFGKEQVPGGQVNPATTLSSTPRFVRDPEVVAWVLSKAKESCEACGVPAPFRRKDGTPFLEAHHLRPLAEGGPDTVDNALACCPNCHRRLHYGADRARYRREVLGRVPRLKDHPKRKLEPGPALKGRVPS